MPKSVVRLINSSKNKLNSEIIFIFHSNPNAHLVSVWIHVHVHVFSSSAFSAFFFLIFFIFVLAVVVDQFSHEQCTRILFMDPQISLFNNFFIKNWSHSTIHTFKNYFATIFSVFNYQFQQNKFYSKRPLVFIFWTDFCFGPYFLVIPTWISKNWKLLSF